MPKWRITAVLAAVFSLLVIGSPAANAVVVTQPVAEEGVSASPFPAFKPESTEGPSANVVTAPDIRGVAETASRLPVAVNATTAKANQAALASKVKAAIAAGDGRKLLETTKNPDVLTDVLRYGSLHQGNVRSQKVVQKAPEYVGQKGPISLAYAARLKVVAHSAGCYGSPWNEHYWTEFGGTVAWVYVRENGWCGQYGRITWYGGPTFASWQWGPFCLGGKGANYSWDYYPSWIHMAHWATLGVVYPWGCFTYLPGGKTVLRIAWNGYYDYANDYGF